MRMVIEGPGMMICDLCGSAGRNARPILSIEALRDFEDDYETVLNFPNEPDVCNECFSALKSVVAKFFQDRKVGA